ncbi:MAG: hypothetical protein PUP92_15930 [Rhizonema sp. PD38]|nr:hypothetical protein [Rhizonema sp. PD38]
MFQLLHILIQALQPALTPICFVTAWVVVGLLLWNIWTSVRNGMTYVNRMHRIPCSGCQFFTESYYLKCTVRPTSALTEDAINCSDFCPKDIRTTRNAPSGKKSQIVEK